MQLNYDVLYQYCHNLPHLEIIHNRKVAFSVLVCHFVMSQNDRHGDVLGSPYLNSNHNSWGAKP